MEDDVKDRLDQQARDNEVLQDRADKAVSLDQNKTARQAPDDAAPAIVAREAKEGAEALDREADVRAQGGDDPGRPGVLSTGNFFSGGGVSGAAETGTPPGAPDSTAANDALHGGIKAPASEVVVDHATTPARAAQRAAVAQADEVQETDNAISASNKAAELRARADEAQKTADSLKAEAESAELQASEAGAGLTHKVRIKFSDRKGEEVYIRGPVADHLFDDSGVAVGVTNEGVKALQARFGADQVQVLD